MLGIVDFLPPLFGLLASNLGVYIAVAMWDFEASFDLSHRSLKKFVVEDKRMVKSSLS